MTRHYSLSEKDNWRTNPDLIADIGPFDLDPCAADDTDIGEVNYTITDDGLEKMWFGRVFVNPPFSYKEEWLEKAVSELESGRVETIIMLLPDGTDTKGWWHSFVAPYSNRICFHYGRLSYYDENWELQKNPTFGTAIIVFGNCPTDLEETLQEYGHVVQTVTED